MATASGDEKRRRRPVMPLVAYAVVLASLGWAGVAFWIGGRGDPPGLLRSDRASAAISTPAPIELMPAARALKLPPRPAESEATTPTKQEPAVSPSPSQGEARNNDLTPSVATKPEPPKAACKVDVGPWPADATEQGKAIQILLRDLGFYGGTTYGTVGPTTRAAIRKFQLATDQPETGESSELLFDSLKKRCASSAP